MRQPLERAMALVHREFFFRELKVIERKFATAARSCPGLEKGNLPNEVVNGRWAVYDSAHKQAVDQVFSAVKGRLATDHESGDNLAVDQVFAQDLFDVVGRV
jgi:hypothetical protein